MKLYILNIVEAVVVVVCKLSKNSLVQTWYESVSFRVFNLEESRLRRENVVSLDVGRAIDEVEFLKSRLPDDEAAEVDDRRRRDDHLILRHFGERL